MIQSSPSGALNCALLLLHICTRRESGGISPLPADSARSLLLRQLDVTAVAPPRTLRVGVEHGAYQLLHQYVLCPSAWMAACPYADV